MLGRVARRFFIDGFGLRVDWLIGPDKSEMEMEMLPGRYLEMLPEMLPGRYLGRYFGGKKLPRIPFFTLTI